MKYALLIYTGTAMEEYGRLTEQEQRSVLSEYLALAQEPGVLGSAQLQPPVQRELLLGVSACGGQRQQQYRSHCANPEPAAQNSTPIPKLM